MEQKYARQYVGMDVFYTPEGVIEPKAIHWPDGHIYEVKMVDKRLGSSKRAGGAGVEYDIDVYGEECTYRRRLYLVDDRWFVEVKA